MDLGHSKATDPGNLNRRSHHNEKIVKRKLPEPATHAWLSLSVAESLLLSLTS